MTSLEGRNRGMPETDGPALEARLAGLEDEAARLRAEIALLQDEIRWLTGEASEHGDPARLSHGWLTSGWVRASLLLGVVAIVALVSVPYLLALVGPSPRPQADPAPVAVQPAGPPADAVTTAAPSVAPAATPRAPAREYIPDPTFVRAEEDRSAAPSRTARRERARPAPSEAPLDAPAPIRSESP